MQHEYETQPGNLIFALDIGTRSVIGVVGTQEGDIVKIQHVAAVEHVRRAVVDGQIEDIEQTARVAALVKESLENKTGYRLQNVHVAAAGRVLKTQRATAQIEYEEKRLIGAGQVFQLESQAIQNAYEKLLDTLSEQDQDLSFYSVGHSIISYTLDGYTFSTLIGHSGKVASAELIATFLPNEVVESLYNTMQMIGLKVSSVTLEPIAAISAVIPKELRLLNIALVDVGAGTSDIAVTSGGSVVAYTMATVAGDEVTEQIMRSCLVDFEAAEQMKFRLSEGKQEITYTNIFGAESSISAHELLGHIDAVVDVLAHTIAEKIMEANGGKAPMAVFMVGGGSRTPGLCPRVAMHLSIDENKVAIGGNNYMKRMIHADEQYINAEYATPIGIMITAAVQKDPDEFYVTLNGDQYQLQGSGTTTVMEVLLRAGYQYNQIMGRSGKSLTYELNGERQVVRGELPSLANILLNGKIASITTPLQVGDEIEFTPATNGADADGQIEQVLGMYNPFEVVFNGKYETAGTVVRINGAPAKAGQVLQQMDKVDAHQIDTLIDFITHKGLEMKDHKVLINGQPTLPTDILRPGDRIEYVAVQHEPAVLEPEKTIQTPTAKVKVPVIENSLGNNAAHAIQIILNGEAVHLEPKEDDTDFYFFDVLNYMDIDPQNPQGEIVIQRNGKNASYIEQIKEGDEINIYWNA